MSKPRVLFAFLVVVLLLAACSGDEKLPSIPPALTATSAPAPTATSEPTPTAWAIPFEGVVQILAMYYDQAGDLQLGWTGSGTIISSDGLILTNAHVVLSDPYYQVDELVVALTVSADQEPVPSYFAEVMQADEPLDIAVIRITHDIDGNPVQGDLGLPVVPLGDSDQLRLGDPVTILGYPGIGGDNITLTSGQVSGFTAEPGRDDPRAFVKTDATIAGGNSGGLAADADGRLIGIPTQLGYGGDDQFVDCRVLVDTNRDGSVDDLDNCVPTGGFINALRPVKLALPLIEAAQRGEVNVVRVEQPVVDVSVPVAGNVLFFDDFSDTSSGLLVDYVDESQANYYFDGEYFLEVYPESFITLDYYIQSYDDIVIGADVRFATPADDGGAAILCRLDPETFNFYSFELSEDGYYSIYKHENDEWIPLVEWVYSDFVLQNVNKPFRMSAVCDGNQLSLSMNGRLLAEVTDSSFTSGFVALSASTYINPNLAVAFDNLEISTPLGALPTGGALLLADDFEDPSVSFEEANTAEYISYFGEGLYVYEVYQPEYAVWNWYLDPFADVAVSADVIFLAGATDGEAALLCRMDELGQFYRFVISVDGFFVIQAYDGVEFFDLMEWTYSDYVYNNAEAFRMTAVCNGNRLILGMNDQILGEVRDDVLIVGGTGIGAGAFTTGGVAVAFDNFEVREVE